tara:strand:- start:337 stop:582 length:246 start_codon:yes stop_codon:yes gene_type:complete
MSKQILLDYLNGEIINYDYLITGQLEAQNNIRTIIAMQEQTIANCEAQIQQSNVDIAKFEVDKEYVREIIVIVEASALNKN